MKTVAGVTWFSTFARPLAFVYFALFGIVWITVECVYDVTRKDKGRRGV